MKKAIAIIVFGLLLSGCAPTEKQIAYKIEYEKNQTNYNWQRNYYLSKIQNSKAALASGFVLGLSQYSNKGGGNGYGNSESEATNDAYRRCENDIKKLNKKYKLYCQMTYGWATRTTKGYKEYKVVKQKQQEAQAAQSTTAQSTSSEQLSFTTSIGKHKNTCKELGFTPGTEKFGDCALKLVELEVAQTGNREAVQQIQIVQQEAPYDGWMGELGLSILRGDFDKKVQQPAYRFPTNQRSICRWQSGGIGQPYMTCTTR